MQVWSVQLVILCSSTEPLCADGDGGGAGRGVNGGDDDDVGGSPRAGRAGRAVRVKLYYRIKDAISRTEPCHQRHR